MKISNNEVEMTTDPPEQKSGIVANGGWMECEIRQRTKHHFYSLMSVLWIFPSLGALAIFFTGDLSWRLEPELSAKLERVPIEQWMALAILFIQPWFVVFSIRTKAAEPEEVAKFSGRNPDYDPKNLY
jgi:hypothetical protein